MRRRVDRRIASVLGKISGLSKDEVREMVELEYQQAANAGVVDKEKAEKEAEAEVEAEAEAGEVGETESEGKLTEAEAEAEASEKLLQKDLERNFEVKEQFVIRGSVPMYEEDASIERLPILIDDKPLGFQDLVLGTLKMGIESVENGYEKIDQPAINMYVPIETGREMRVGAFEESGVRLARDSGLRSWDDITSGSGSGSGTNGNGSKSPRSPRSDDKKDSNSGNSEPADEFLASIAAKSLSLEIGGPCLPPNLKEYFPPANMNLLRHDKSVRVFAPVNTMLTETDVEWNVRPRAIHREVPRSIGRMYSMEIGSTTLHSHRNIDTISDSWRPRRERRGGALRCLAVSTRQDLWDVMDCPQEQMKMVEEDNMSDSESDDENAADDKPTPEEARNLFAKLAGNFVEEEYVGGSGGKGAEEGDVAGQQVMRDRKFLELERKKREVRERLASRLPHRMKRIQGEIKNLKHSILLQTPFHELTVQYPEEA